MSDPIHEEDEKWYFWNEVWADRHGPFDTEVEAREALHVYCTVELNYESDPLNME